jgi:hypothetical protein
MRPQRKLFLGRGILHRADVIKEVVRHVQLVLSLAGNHF